MKKVLGAMSKLIAAAFSVAVLALLMSLTYGALQYIFPNSFANQMWGLVMFDIAAMCWALIFVFQSHSTGQYAAAGLGFVVGFVGTLGMVASEVILSGNLIANVNTEQIGRWMVYGFIGVTAIHAALVYIHHGTAPEIAEQINVGVARGEVVSQAIADATKTIEAEKQELSQAIYNDIVSQVKRDLGMHPIQDTVFDRRKAYEVPYPVTWAKDDVNTASGNYAHLYPPHGDRQHPDVVFARIPSDELHKIRQAWLDYDNSRIKEDATADDRPLWEKVQAKLEEVKQNLRKAQVQLWNIRPPAPTPQDAPDQDKPADPEQSE